MENREKTIVKVSVQGIVVNVILVAFKAFVGLVSNSISVILDAVNNLSDVLSQIITIAGTKLSMKRPDKKHPYGYGRIEYISSAIVACLVLFAGFTSAKESVVKIFKPVVSEYTNISLLIIGVAVFVKFFFGLYVKAAGKKVSSDALLATGTDSLMDSILSLSTFVAALISRFFGVNLESYLGLILSVFIIKAGLEIIKETLGSLIGGRADSELSVSIKKKIRTYEGVHGAYDLILHDYGPSRSIGSVHIEVDANMTADKFHLLSRRIISDIYNEYKIILTVGLYASNDDEKSAAMKAKAFELAKQHEHFMNLHGFFVDEERKLILFDTLISYKAPSAYQVGEDIRSEVAKEFPGYNVHVNVDHDFSD